MDRLCLRLQCDPMGLWNRFCRCAQMDRFFQKLLFFL